MSNNRITPFVKRMRAKGGTIYTFSSAVEDIGLNINERNNIVKISHFALLDIPNIAEPSTGVYNNTFNVRNIAGAWEYERNSVSIKDGRVLIAESFQNYALNLESNLLNQTSYNPELTATVSERVFWKWMKETGSIRWTDPSTSTQYDGYRWIEDLDDGDGDYNSVVKYVGQVSAGNVRIDTFGTYNETYILVPTSHGQTRAYWKQVEDDNYYHGMLIGDLGENILGREGYTKPHPDGLSMTAYYDFVDSSTVLSGGNEYDLYYDPSVGSFTAGWWYIDRDLSSITDNAYMTDTSAYIDSSIYHTNLYFDPTVSGNDIYFRRSNVDCLSIEVNMDNLKEIYGDATLTWDKMAIEYSVNDQFSFNAALIYYTVYNATRDEILGTNLLGIMFLDAPSGSSSDIVTGGAGIMIPSLDKLMSGTTGFGTSYSLRLNIKTDNMLDDTTATIVDMATSDQLWAEDWTEAFANLDTAVNTLTQQNSTINFISGQYIIIQDNQTQILNKIDALEYKVNDIDRDITGTAGTIAMFSDGDDPLIESSIYMNIGNVGIHVPTPNYPLEIDGSTKTKNIILENGIYDTSGNLILGYGSPIQIGSSTNNHEISIYAGTNVNPLLNLDTSLNVSIDGSLHITGNLTNNLNVIGSGTFSNDVSIASSLHVVGSTTLMDPIFAGNIVEIDDDLTANSTIYAKAGIDITGDVSLGGILKMDSWSIDPSGDWLVFSYGGSEKVVFTSDGSIFQY